MAEESPPAVPGDSKDWTWVLDRPCPDCGFDVRAFPRREMGRLLRAIAAAWLAVLDRNAAELRRRPEPRVWSPLEYACHVRDVFELFSGRLELMLEQDGPHYPNWDQDVTAVDRRYDLADPVEVAANLIANAGRLADQFDAVRDEAWERTGFRSDGAAFTIESFGRYLIHDPVHHLHDVGVDFSA